MKVALARRWLCSGSACRGAGGCSIWVYIRDLDIIIDEQAFSLFAIGVYLILISAVEVVEVGERRDPGFAAPGSIIALFYELFCYVRFVA